MYCTVRLWHKELKEYVPFPHRMVMRCRWKNGFVDGSVLNSKMFLILRARESLRFWGEASLDFHVYKGEMLVYVAGV